MVRSVKLMISAEILLHHLVAAAAPTSSVGMLIEDDQCPAVVSNDETSLLQRLRKKKCENDADCPEALVQQQQHSSDDIHGLSGDDAKLQGCRDSSDCPALTTCWNHLCLPMPELNSDLPHPEKKKKCEQDDGCPEAVVAQKQQQSNDDIHAEALGEYDAESQGESALSPQPQPRGLPMRCRDPWKCKPDYECLKGICIRKKLLHGPQWEEEQEEDVDKKTLEAEEQVLVHQQQQSSDDINIALGADGIHQPPDPSWCGEGNDRLLCPSDCSCVKQRCLSRGSGEPCTGYIPLVRPQQQQSNSSLHHDPQQQALVHGQQSSDEVDIFIREEDIQPERYRPYWCEDENDRGRCPYPCRCMAHWCLEPPDAMPCHYIHSNLLQQRATTTGTCKDNSDCDQRGDVCMGGYCWSDFR